MNNPNNFFFPSSFRIIFSNPLYLIISAITTITFWIILNVAGELLFFSPIWIFYLPDDVILGFILTNITAVPDWNSLEYEYIHNKKFKIKTW